MQPFNSDRLQLSSGHLQTLQALLAQHVPHVEVWAYGSRVTGGAHEGSDLDIVLRNPEDLTQTVDGWVELKEALQAGALPMLVDVHLWAHLPQAFHRNIEAGYVVIRQCNTAGEAALKGGGYASETKTLSTICSLIVDCPHSTPLWTDFGHIVLRNQNIKNGQLDLSTPSFTDQSHFVSRNRRAKPTTGDIVITREAPMGDVCMIPVGLECCLGQRQVLLRPNPQLTHSRFVLYALQSQTVQDQISWNEGTGSTVSNLRIPILEALQIPHPSLPEQRAIAHILGALDDKIELNRKQNETLEAMAQALFKSWFVDFDPVRAKMDGRWQRGESLPGLPAHLYDLFPDRLVESELGEVPEGWEVKPASALIEFNPTEPLRRGTAAPYLDMASLPTMGSWPDAPINREFGSGMRFRNGDTLLARITPCLENGKTAYIQCLADRAVAWGSTEYIVMRARPPVPPEYGYLLARFSSFREHAIRSMTGTSGRQRVQSESVAGFKVNVPDNTKLWFEFATQVAPAFQGIRINSEQSRTLSQLRDTLLPKLISGELRLGDAERFVGAAV